MTWASVGDFFAMGGAGFFVWMSYGAWALIVLAEVRALRNRRARARRALLQSRGGSMKPDQGRTRA